MESLEIEVCGIRFKNPIIFGSAGLAYSYSGMRRLIKAGFSAVVTKTTTVKKFDGGPTPRCFFYDKERMFLNSSEASINPGIDKMSEYVKCAKKIADEENAHIIGSCAGRSPEEISEIAQRFEEAGAVAVECDLTCPNSWDFRSKQYPGEGWEKLGTCIDPKRAPAFASRVTKAVKKSVDIPVWLNVITVPLLLKPHSIEVIDRSKPDAYKLIGPSAPQMWIDTETGEVMPGAGGFGPTRKSSTIRYIADIARITKTPLVSSGGLHGGNDIIEAFMVGTSAVQVCSGVYRNVNVVRKALVEIEDFMKRHSYSSLEEIRGMSLKNLSPKPNLLSWHYEGLLAGVRAALAHPP